MKQAISKNGYGGTIKLRALRAKGHLYPQFRLPERFSNCLGDKYRVYASEDGKTIASPRGDILSELVLQQSPEVLQPQSSATSPSSAICPELLRCSLRESRSADRAQVRRRLSLRFENSDEEEPFNQPKHRNQMACRHDNDSSGGSESLAS